MPKGFFTRGYGRHVTFLLFALPSSATLYTTLSTNTDALLRQWYTLSIAIPVLHQWIVWLFWRGQLKFSLLTRIFGRYDLVVWGGCFFRWMLIAMCALPAAYGIWSVIRYFGLARALGADHFRSRYREMPLDCRGAYRYSDNVMYGMVFLLLWALAFLLDSPLALVSASFQHAYIWVHYHCTEEPDMRVLY